MRKVIAGINMTLDGYCDHTAVIADAELHDYYTDMLRNAGALIYGRITYLLMENYWPALAANPSGERDMDEFAAAIDGVPKLVFSKTLTKLNWKTATLAKRSLEEEVLALRQKPGKDIYAGSPSMIVALTKLGLIDEYMLCVHPVIAGAGLPLFKSITDKVVLKLLDTKTFGTGTMALHYAR